MKPRRVPRSRISRVKKPVAAPFGNDATTRSMTFVFEEVSPAAAGHVAPTTSVRTRARDIQARAIGLLPGYAPDGHMASTACSRGNRHGTRTPRMPSRQPSFEQFDPSIAESFL